MSVRAALHRALELGADFELMPDGGVFVHHANRLPTDLIAVIRAQKPDVRRELLRLESEAASMMEATVRRSGGVDAATLLNRVVTQCRGLRRHRAEAVLFRLFRERRLDKAGSRILPALRSAS